MKTEGSIENQQPIWVTATTSLCRRRKRGTHRQGLGRSRGGFTAKLHAATNADGLPVGLLITPGETHDAKVATDLMEPSPRRPKALLGDKRYDSDDIHHHIYSQARCR